MKCHRQIVSSVAAVLAALFLSGCMIDIDSAAGEIDTEGWRSGDTCTAVFPNKDTVSLRTIEIFLVYDKRLGRSYDSLRLSVTTLSPDSVSVTETLTVYPHSVGDEGSSRYFESSFPYRSNVLLSHEGDYMFCFSHDSKIPVRGLKSAGVTIRKHGE